MEIEPTSTNYDTEAFVLLSLLAQNALAEFHTHLESIDQNAFQNNNIKQVISMEQFFIEGRYNKVLECASQLTLENSSTLLPSLKKTIVNAVADTIQVAYKELPISYAEKILMVDNNEQLNYIIQERNWNLNGNKLVFGGLPIERKKGESLNSFQFIEESLSLIKEIDELF
ncbi:26S proteasome non-ATPase regulatory subunit [Entamoeba marina]